MIVLKNADSTSVLRFDKVYENLPDMEGGCPIFLCLLPAFVLFVRLKGDFYIFAEYLRVSYDNIRRRLSCL